MFILRNRTKVFKHFADIYIYIYIYIGKTIRCLIYKYKYKYICRLTPAGKDKIMIAKTAEGLIGASAAVKEIRTPLKVFKEARNKGDTATMERSMGYISNFNADAWEHKERTENGLKEEAVEAKEKAQLEREELAQRIKENREESEKRLEEASEGVVDTETSGKTDGFEEGSSELQNPYGEGETTKTEQAAETGAPVTYTKTGTVKPASVDVQFSVSV